MLAFVHVHAHTGTQCGRTTTVTVHARSIASFLRATQEVLPNTDHLLCATWDAQCALMPASTSTIESRARPALPCLTCRALCYPFAPLCFASRTCRALCSAFAAGLPRDQKTAQDAGVFSLLSPLLLSFSLSPFLSFFLLPSSWALAGGPDLPGNFPGPSGNTAMIS